MKGDFTRELFHPGKGFLGVLQQQGRAMLCDDWNNQTFAVLHGLQSLARDLIGEHGGTGDGFKIGKTVQGALTIGAGHYYVQGWLCETEGVEYKQQPFRLSTQGEEKFPELPTGVPYLVYLDVWLRHVAAVEDEALTEVALGGADTTTRVQLIWQVRTISGVGLTPADTLTSADPYEKFLKLLDAKTKEQKFFYKPVRATTVRPQVKARARTDNTADTPCVLSPSARYRGMENQLYRVEIHQGSGRDGNEPAGFKWSRENGSVVFPILNIGGNALTLAHFGRDERLGLHVGDLVEAADDTTTLGISTAVSPLYRVKAKDTYAMTVELEAIPPMSGSVAVTADPEKHAYLRRWEGFQKVVEGEWLTLEDGIQIEFQKGAAALPHNYHTGDYWLIPARTETGDILWPQVSGGKEPDSVIAQEVEHFYAPLAQIDAAGTIVGLRRLIQQNVKAE